MINVNDSHHARQVQLFMLSPNHYDSGPEQSLARRILDVLCRLLPCLKSLANWLFPPAALIPGNPSPIRGIQKIEGGRKVQSGAMLGCHLITGINLNNPSQQYFIHTNTFSGDNPLQFMNENPTWHYSVFFTKKTMQEGFAEITPEQYADNYNLKYNGHISTALYVDDESMVNINVEYNPWDTTIKVRGLIETHISNQLVRSCQTFEGKMCPEFQAV